MATSDDDQPEAANGPTSDERARGDSPRRVSETFGKAAEGATATFRKALSQGFRSVRSGEEKIRGIVSDAMPKELVTYIKGAIDTGRDEVVRIVGNQTRKFLEGIDVSGEVAKILTSLSFEIKTEIRFIPNDQKIKPDIKTSIRSKKVKPDDEE